MCNQSTHTYLRATHLAGYQPVGTSPTMYTYTHIFNLVCFNRISITSYICRYILLACLSCTKHYALFCLAKPNDHEHNPKPNQRSPISHHHIHTAPLLKSSSPLRKSIQREDHVCRCQAIKRRRVCMHAPPRMIFPPPHSCWCGSRNGQAEAFWTADYIVGTAVLQQAISLLTE